MMKNLPSILLVVAVAAAIVLFVSGNVLAGLLCVIAAMILLVATGIRLKREGRLPASIEDQSSE